MAISDDSNAGALLQSCLQHAGVLPSDTSDPDHSKGLNGKILLQMY